MKAVKKLLALMLAVLMLCGLPFVANAAEPTEYVTYTATQTASTDTTVTVQLKFSEPVWLRSGNVWLCNHINPAACSGNKTLWQTGVVSSSPALTSTFQGNYADTYTLTFSRCTDATHTNHYNEWKDGLPSDAMVRIVDLISQYGGTALDGKVDEFVFKSQSGKPIAAVRADGGMEVAAENVELMPKMLSAQVLDASDSTKVEVLITFNKPVTRRDATSHVFLCDRYNPNPGVSSTINGVTYTSWQKAPSALEYIGGQVGADGRTYSTQIKLTFPSPGTPLPSTAGVRIVEYNAPAAEKNTGEVWSEVFADKNDIGLAPTIKDGSVDIEWKTVEIAEAAQNVVSIAVDNNTITVNFSMMVKAIDVSGITVGAAQATAAARLGGDANGAGTWVLTFDRALAQGDVVLTLPANSVTMAYNGAKVAKALVASTDPWYGFEETGATIELQDAPYNFMNTDTGRSITIPDGETLVDEFTVVRKSANSNLIALEYEGRYVDMTGPALLMSDVPVYYLLKACANERYQLMLSPNYVLIDSDKGVDTCVTADRVSAASTDIATGWYITASGDPRPLRLMPLGDSLTDGVNYDRVQGELMVSYREELSQELTEYFGRIVFVGAKKTATTTLDETRLLRHAGYSGYVVKQIWAENTYEQTYQHPGIDPFINDLTAKYNPDIVCLLLGHNDNGQINMNKAHTGKSRATLIAEWLVEYEAFVRKIEATMDKNDTVFCSLLTINKDTGTTNNKDEINQSLRPLIEGLMEEGLQVGIADNWSSTQAVGTAGFNAADSTHLNARGYAALAEEWYDVITETYDANGVRRKPEATAPLFEEGWQLNAVGWWYQYSDGSYPANGWAFIGESWYYFNAGGYMMTGWVLDGGTWYYLTASGAMATGWVLDGGTWYYMNAGGAMATGWVLDGSTWYYMNASGAMMTGWVLDGGTWYYMNASGAMVTGWVLDGGTWYYMNPNGAMATGWILDNGVWYLLSSSGAWIG